MTARKMPLGSLWCEGVELAQVFVFNKLKLAARWLRLRAGSRNELKGYPKYVMVSSSVLMRLRPSLWFSLTSQSEDFGVFHVPNYDVD
ncbi:MAG: hypothetical protein ACKESB_02270 [Candidatus Hodgkinia cicadicola]